MNRIAWEAMESDKIGIIKCPIIKNFPTPKLLILDIDGLLIKREYIGPQQKDFSVGKDRNVFFAANNIITLHPQLELFWKKLATIPNLKVGLWTSSNQRTFSKYIESVVPDYFREKLLFVWDRNMCSRDLDSKLYYPTVKKFSTVFENPVINEIGMWNEDNVLIVDDSERKLRFNPEKTKFIYNSWENNDLIGIFKHEFFGEFADVPDLASLKISDN